VRSADLIATRLQALKRATALTTDEGIVTPHALLVQALVAQLRVTLRVIADCDKALAQHAQGHPDFPLFNTLPGAGAVFAPRRLVAFGEQRERSTTADALQTYAGIAPVTERSGKKPGSTGTSNAPFLPKRSSHGPLSRSGIPSGHASITSSNAKGQGAPSCCAGLSVQMDAPPLSLLAGAHSVR
jgi:hypothetical protein